tara:strand:+ start:247 stop:945 length:699 start_codon:yes stop_codon:yes gene_type:complete
MIKDIAIAYLLLSLAYAQIDFNNINERLEYNAKFRFIDAGNVSLEIRDIGENQKHISTLFRSNKVLDMFYPIDDSVSTIFDGDFNLKRAYKRISQGSYKKIFRSVINTNDNVVITNSNIENYSFDIFDPMGLIYYIRSTDLLLLDNKFSIIDNGKIVDIQLKISYNEKVIVNNREYSCIKVIPYGIDSSKIFKNDGLMSIWFTTDQDRIPVRIEQTTNIGPMILDIKEIKLQ